MPRTRRPIRASNGSITSGGNPSGYSGERLDEADPHHLPVTRRGVLAGRDLGGASVARARLGARSDAFDPRQTFRARAPPGWAPCSPPTAAATCPSVFESVVAVGRGVGGVSHAPRVAHDHADPGDRGPHLLIPDPLPSACGAPPSGPRVRRVVDLTQMLLGHQGVDLRRGDARVPEKLLHDAHVRATFQQMRRERVTQRVRRHSSVDPGRSRRTSARIRFTLCRDRRPPRWFSRSAPRLMPVANTGRARVR